MAISITGNNLTFDELYRVALSGETVSLAPEARASMQASRAVVEQLSTLVKRLERELGEITSAASGTSSPRRPPSG